MSLVEKVIEGRDKVIDSPIAHSIGMHVEDNAKREIHLIFDSCSIFLDVTTSITD